ncbi:MAG: cytochrome B [Gammaproteobacteria bacterium]|jgi:cytochrome b|nr:cytochrome B [Gammaproteobacteria bacterium]MBT3724341.1 cytochrome B [Gammaproteobacteria bacterium]MBT4076106.1 cytochrome B [Gammaproteobacteria bacterium]MBT4193604.1 cytochrome B [Gammaproteobacteria bacterium]MBT4452045.1 cytochrome B [Gammaproteobacteria bacterium]
MSTQTNTPDTIKVWDPLVRLFHWSLVISFFLAFITEDDFINLHVAAGYAVAMLIGFRVVWGLIGTRYARFTQFIKSPAQVLFYLMKMLKFDVPHYIGHNPAAAAMIVSLLISIILVSITGMAIIAAEGQGPLAGTFFAGFNAEWMEEIHEFFANFTMLLVLLHVAGVFISSMMEGENLARAMVTGRKKYRSEIVDR